MHEYIVCSYQEHLPVIPLSHLLVHIDTHNNKFKFGLNVYLLYDYIIKNEWIIDKSGHGRINVYRHCFGICFSKIVLWYYLIVPFEEEGVYCFAACRLLGLSVGLSVGKPVRFRSITYQLFNRLAWNFPCAFALPLLKFRSLGQSSWSLSQ